MERLSLLLQDGGCHICQTNENNFANISNKKKLKKTKHKTQAEQNVAYKKDKELTAVKNYSSRLRRANKNHMTYPAPPFLV